MKIGLISDLHVNAWRKTNSFFHHIEKAIEFFIDECIKRDVKYIFIAGDTFHSKNEIAADMLLRINKIIDDLRSQGRTVFLIKGNHDTYKKHDTEKNLLDIYTYFDNIRVINDYDSIELDNIVFHMLPYYFDSGMLQKINETNIINNKKNILISHFGVNGFTLLQSEASDIHSYHETISPTLLSKFDWTFLGHFHSFQSRGKITYISSPFQSRHGDEFGKHGFVFFDTTKFQYEFVENIYSPQYETLILSKKTAKDILTKENMFLRLIIQEFINKDILHKIYKKLKSQNNVIKISSDFNKVFTIDKLATVDGWEDIVYETPEDVITGFVKKMPDIELPEGVTKEELLEVMFND